MDIDKTYPINFPWDRIGIFIAALSRDWGLIPYGEKIMNKKLFILIIFSVLCILLFSCSKKNPPPENTIAFESLFTDESTSRNRSYGMGQLVGLGCSMLIGQNQEERNEIKQFLIKAFKIRNNIVHGLAVEISMINNKKYSMREISSQLQEYLKTSIKKLI